MSRRQKPSGAPEDDERLLTQAVVDAVRALGWLIPETEEEVAALEGNDNLGLRPLPPELQDPYAVLVRSNFLREISSETEPIQNSEVMEELARAAREGRGSIPDEVEELMRQDREAAERSIRSDGK